MKKIILFILCIGIGLSAGSWVVWNQQQPPEEESFKDGHVIARHVGTSVANTAAIEELVKQLPFSEALTGVSVDGTTVKMTYEPTEKGQADWTGSNGKAIQYGNAAFLESRLSKLIMHQTLALFLSVSDLSELQIHYRDSFSEVTFDMDRQRIEDYTPRDIERASSSANRFNRVVVEDYVLVDSRRTVFFEKFQESLQILPEK
ncbi:hypothetical protein [Exiguobacterium artemiae]|uniref:hypothetical protein n=1 Tax=Exiguobacterium artemiae TaxID=340145 RepID=UPI00047C2623|nr:hypothetical protein [Exiguobacterium sibiricum]